MFRAYKEKFLENFEVYQDQVRTWWSNLNQREKIILGSATGLFVALLGFFLFKQSISIVQQSLDRSDLAQQVDRIQDRISNIRALQPAASRYERLSRNTDQDFQLQEEISIRAQRAGVKLSAIKPASQTSALADKNDQLIQISIRDDATLDRSLRFLDSVQSILGVRLINLKMKPSFKDRSLFEVDALFAYSEGS